MKEDPYNRAKHICGSDRSPTLALIKAKEIDVWNWRAKKWEPKHPKDHLEAGLAYRVRPPKKVFIHVHGGVAYCDRVPKGVVVKIIDHDNEGHQ